MAESKHTTSHNIIKKWAEARKGKPAAVKDTHGKKETGIVRLSFPGRKTNNDNLTEIPWDEFFEEFEKSKLAMVYQDKTKTGRQSRFNKLVSRDSFKKSSKTSDTAKSKSKSKKSGTSAANTKSKAASNRKPVKKQTSPGKIRSADDPLGGEYSGIPGTASKKDIGDVASGGTAAGTKGRGTASHGKPGGGMPEK